MLPLKNSHSRYGLIAILFHWIMALLIIFMLAFGLYMTGLPKSLVKLKYYGWHKEIGLLILGLAILRGIYWISDNKPLLPNTMRSFEKFAAHAMHYLLYLCMFAMPLTGWLMSSAAGIPVSFFGLVMMPDIIAPNPSARVIFKTLHEWIGYGFIAAICGHALAALHHHFLKRDDVLRRMLP